MGNATPRLTLVSHLLCPYVQRAAIVLAEKGVPFERRDVDLARKPDWFLALSPLGKTPVLLAGDQPVFESAVICEYLDETVGPRLHPADPLQRARERGWMEFASATLNTIAAFYNAADAAALERVRGELAGKLAQLDSAASVAGPFFAGERFGLVDACFGPVFRYFDVFEANGEASFTATLPRVHAWRRVLRERRSVREAVDAGYPERLRRFVRERGSALGRRFPAGSVPA